MHFKKSIGMKLASLITMLVLVAGTPTTTFFVYAEEGSDSAPAASSDTSSSSSSDSGSSGDTGASATGGGGGSGGDGGGGTNGGDAGTGASGGDASADSSGASDASGGTGGDGGTGGGSTDGGTAGDGGAAGTGGDAAAEGSTTDASGGDGGAGGDGGSAQGSGTGGDAGTGGNGGTADSEADSSSEADAAANGGDGGTGGEGGTAAGGSNDGGTGADAGMGGDANADAEGDEGATAEATGGNGGGGGGGGVVLGASDEASTVVGTGDASSEAVGFTQGNTTEVNTGTSSEETELELSDLFVASSTASSTATTGDIIAQDPDGILARLGNASALAILINIFNIAIKDSVGSILFLKNPIGSALDFTSQFMNIFGTLAGVNGECSFMGCSSDEASFRFLGDSISEVNNEAITRAQTGGFEGNSEGGVIDVKTGNGDAMSVIWNLGHLTLANSRYLVILMANQGDLNGDVILPDGDFFKKLSSVAKISLGSTYIASSTANVDNLADSNAASGDNSAIGDETLIDTGNANAHSSAGTMANMVGAPMCFIINIGGNWNGAVKRLPDTFTHERTAFGEIICGTGGGEDRGENREEMDIDHTNYAKIVNKAISDAITGDVHGEALRVALETGDASAFSHIMNLITSDIIGQDWIFANFAISGDWNGDLEFGPEPGGTDILGEIANQISQGTSGTWNTQKDYQPKINFTKNASVTSVASPAQVEYEIVVDNRGGEAHQVVVNDTMTGPDGAVIGKQMWKLGTVAAKEKVTIKYTIDFAANAKPGYYTNTAVISGLGELAEGASTIMSKDVIEILPAGVQPGAQCEPLLTEYIRPLRANAPAQVKLLQTFLNTKEGENLEVNGVYDSETQTAVKELQLKYADEILTPWGITTATGNVYYTTQKKINTMNCADGTEFGLNAQQQSEIKSFKAKLFAPKTNVGDLLKMYDVGQKKGMPTAKGPLLMPPPALPSIFEPVSNTDAKPVSMMNLPVSLLKNWLLSAVPLVEAAER